MLFRSSAALFLILVASVNAQNYTGPLTGANGAPYPSGVTNWAGVDTSAFTAGTSEPSAVYPTFPTTTSTASSAGNSTAAVTTTAKSAGSSLTVGYFALVASLMVAWAVGLF